MKKENRKMDIVQNRKDLEGLIVDRAIADEEFRKALLEDPRKEIGRILGVELPGNVEIQVLEETPERFYLVLPFATDELSDEQLDKAAGGADVLFGLNDAMLKIDGEIHKNRAK